MYEVFNAVTGLVFYRTRSESVARIVSTRYQCDYDYVWWHIPTAVV